jgi:hypothetical protein
MKRTGLLFCVFLCVAGFVAAQTEADFDTEPNGDGVVITGYRGQGGDVAIPAAIGEKAVVGIAEWAFERCASLTQITIPDSVTMIGRGAFAHCTSLTSITLPAGITFISRGVFGGCSGLESITIPENITSLGPLAFARCSRLKSVTLPENISAAYGVFNRCDSLDLSIRADLRERFGDVVFDDYGESY